MKKKFEFLKVAFAIAALLYTVNVRAQTTAANQLRMSVGLETSKTTGNATIGSNFSLGGTIRLQYGLSDNFAVTLTSGAYHFFMKTNPATGHVYDSYGVIPIKAGFKWFFAPNVYFVGEAGVGIEETDSGQGPTRFDIAPGLGWANKHWDIGIHYDNFNSMGDNYGLIALRTAYAFHL